MAQAPLAQGQTVHIPVTTIGFGAAMPQAVVTLNYVLGSGAIVGRSGEEIIRTDLAVVHGGDLDAALRRAATLRSTLPRLDGVVLAREARSDLQARGA